MRPGSSSRQSCQARIQRFTAVQICRLPSRRQRVAAKQGGVEWHPGLQRQPLVALAFEQRERCEIPDICAKDPFGEPIWGDGNARQALLPFPEVLLANIDIMQRWLAARIAGVDLEAQDDRLLWFQPEPRLHN
jgi:hypothetical protein